MSDITTQPQPQKNNTNTNQKNNTNLQNAKIPSVEEVIKIENQQFEKICGDIINRINAAKKTGKPVLLVVGETHHRCDNANIELYLLKIAKNAGLKNCFKEETAKMREVENKMIMRKRAGNTALVTSPVAEGIGMKLIPIDINRSDEINKMYDQAMSGEMSAQESNEIFAKDLQNRDGNMAKIITKHNENAICIVGAAHLKGLATNKGISEKYAVVPVSLPMGRGQMEDMLNDKLLPQQIKESLDYIQNDKDVIKINRTHLFILPHYSELISNLFPEDKQKIAEQIPVSQELLAETSQHLQRTLSKEDIKDIQMWLLNQFSESSKQLEIQRDSLYIKEEQEYFRNAKK